MGGGGSECLGDAVFPPPPPPPFSFWVNLDETAKGWRDYKWDSNMVDCIYGETFDIWSSGSSMAHLRGGGLISREKGLPSSYLLLDT